MAQPTVADRLQRRFILMTTDQAIEQALRAQVPSGWEMRVVQDLDEIGDWNDILLHRFLLLDLDEQSAFDPEEIIRRLRMEYLLQIAVFCFGGDEGQRDTVRLLRADRFFDRDRIVEMLSQFLKQYEW